MRFFLPNLSERNPAGRIKIKSPIRTNNQKTFPVVNSISPIANTKFSDTSNNKPIFGNIAMVMPSIQYNKKCVLK